MSITKGFEATAWKEPQGYFLPGPVLDLLAHARALEAMLKKHEWAQYDSEWGTSACPECGAEKPNTAPPKHEPDCQLAKLLEGVE